MPEKSYTFIRASSMYYSLIRYLETHTSHPFIGASLSEPHIIMSTGIKVLSWMDDDDNGQRRSTTSQARAMTSTRTSMGGAPPLLYVAMNGRGYTDPYDHVHNESSASGQAPEEEGPGSC